jgi:mevalonate kinase
MSKFSNGDLVVCKEDIEASISCCVLKVLLNLDDAVLTTMWGDMYNDGVHEYDDDYEDEPGSNRWRKSIVRYQESELLSVEDASKEKKKLELEREKLDKEFEEIREQVRVNMEQASILVEAAAKIIKYCDKEFRDLKQECRPLHNALESGGWSHSTMSC